MRPIGHPERFMRGRPTLPVTPNRRLDQPACARGRCCPQGVTATRNTPSMRPESVSRERDTFRCGASFAISPPVRNEPLLSASPICFPFVRSGRYA